MGYRPGLAERIALFEVANNAPHGIVLLIAGVAYAIGALGWAVAARAPAPVPLPPWLARSPSAPPPAGPAGRRHGRRIHRRPRAPGEP